MTTAMSGDLCRITVIGPAGRVDLAVPVRTTVATLLPVLLKHTTKQTRSGDVDGAEGSWVLQRMGGTPFELNGTPESLDWLEGEQFHLRPAQNPLPELDFDDLADGVATVVNRRFDRWKPEYRRTLFIILSVVAMVTIAAVLTDRGPVFAQVAGATAVASVCFGFALVFGRALADPGISLLFALGAAGFAAVAAASAFDGQPESIAITESALIAGAVAIVAVTGLTLLCQRTIAKLIPATPLLLALVTAAAAGGVAALENGLGISLEAASAIASGALFALIVLSPRVAVKLARLRGPQLPKTGEEMSYDIEPEPSDVVKDRTADADAYLTVVMLAGAILLPVLFHFMMGIAGWSGWTLVLLLASALLLRARTFLGLWQRIGLVIAGTVGYLMVIMHMSATLSPTWRYTLFGGLIVLLIALVAAALRPWPRRMLPFWEYVATVLDVATGVAVLPVLIEVLGGYAWARGLFG